MIVLNFIGLVMVVVCFSVVYGVGSLFGTKANDPLMFIGGPLMVACDLLDRGKRASSPDGHERWYHPRLGGQLFLVPVWIWGMFWALLGTYGLLT